MPDLAAAQVVPQLAAAAVAQVARARAALRVELARLPMAAFRSAPGLAEARVLQLLAAELRLVVRVPEPVVPVVRPGFPVPEPPMLLFPGKTALQIRRCRASSR